jgi:hypothetical protein
LVKQPNDQQLLFLRGHLQSMGHNSLVSRTITCRAWAARASAGDWAGEA